MSNQLSTVLKLQAGCNFRDMGGYISADGRKLKSGILFRSGVMAYFTEADQRQLADLGISTICDLRRSDERSKEATLWPAESSAKIISWDDEPDIEGQGHLAWGKAKAPEDIRESMIALYKEMPFWLENRLRGVFQLLCKNDSLPLLFHCAAGKDRTGLTGGLILSMLGMERDCILADYEQTNTAVNLETFILAHRQAGMGLADKDHPMMALSEDIRHTLLKADRDYLIAAFDVIEQRFGSVEEYLVQHLGVSLQQQEQLRERLLVNV